MGAKSENPQRRSGSGKDVFSRNLTVKANWNRGLFSMKKWESEKHTSWDMPAEGFKGHVAIDGSLLGRAGKWGACGWSVVQLDYDEELELFAWHVWLDGGRIRGPEGGADGVPLPSQESSWTTKVHVDNKGIIDGLW